MDKKEIIEKIKDYSKAVKAELYFDKVVLFGSYADGLEREDSDIDVAFMIDKLDKDINFYELLVTLNRLARKYDCRIEPHVLVKENAGGFYNHVTEHGHEIVVN